MYINILYIYICIYVYIKYPKVTELDCVEHIHTEHTRTYAHTDIHANIHTHTCTNIHYINIYMQAYTHTHIQTNTQKCTLTNKHTCKHTYIHTHGLIMWRWQWVHHLLLKGLPLKLGNLRHSLVRTEEFLAQQADNKRLQSEVTVIDICNNCSRSLVVQAPVFLVYVGPKT